MQGRGIGYGVVSCPARRMPVLDAHMYRKRGLFESISCVEAPIQTTFAQLTIRVHSVRGLPHQSFEAGLCLPRHKDKETQSESKHRESGNDGDWTGDWKGNRLSHRHLRRMWGGCSPKVV